HAGAAVPFPGLRPHLPRRRPPHRRRLQRRRQGGPPVRRRQRQRRQPLQRRRRLLAGALRPLRQLFPRRGAGGGGRCHRRRPAGGRDGDGTERWRGPGLRRPHPAPARVVVPYGQSFSDGLFVGGDPGPGVPPLDPVPVVTVVATTPDTREGSSSPGVFTFSRTGATTSDLVVSVT